MRPPSARVPGSDQASERLAGLAGELEWPRTSGWASASRIGDSPNASGTSVTFRPRCASSRRNRCGSLGALDLSGIHWLIAGGESGPKHRPVDGDWGARTTRSVWGATSAILLQAVGGTRSKSRRSNAGWETVVTDARDPPSCRQCRVIYRTVIHESGSTPSTLEPSTQFSARTSERGSRSSVRHFSPLILFDGFAGRGRYEGNEEGSPLLFFERAQKRSTAQGNASTDPMCLSATARTSRTSRAHRRAEPRGCHD